MGATRRAVTLDAILDDPSQAALLASAADVGVLLAQAAAQMGRLGAASTALVAQLVQLTSDFEPDRLLTVEDAAVRLSVTPDWLYRHNRDLPFTVRMGPGLLRFSSSGLARYIQLRQGHR